MMGIISFFVDRAKKKRKCKLRESYIRKRTNIEILQDNWINYMSDAEKAKYGNNIKKYINSKMKI